MRKGFAVLVAAALTALLPMQASGQVSDSFGLDLEMTPKKAGTLERPRPVAISGTLHVPDLTAGTVVTGGQIVLPWGLVFAGGRYSACSKETIEGEGGANGCPKRSIVGKGSTTIIIDRPGARPKAIFVNGGPRRLWAYTTLYFPALVQEPVAVRIQRQDRRVGVGYELSFDVPRNLLIVAGIPITLVGDFAFRMGGKAYAKSYITNTRRCPKRGYLVYTMTIDYLDADDVPHEASIRGRIACR